MRLRSQRLAWGLLIPTLAILAFVGLLPFFYVFHLSFFNYNVFSAIGQVFNGLDNYRRIVFDVLFLHCLKAGSIFVALVCLIELPLGFGIAVLLNRKFIGKGMFRAILALPLTIAPITIGASWILLTRPGVGPLPGWLGGLGIDYDIGLYKVQTFATVVAMDVWHWTPFVSLAFLAGLASLPRAPYDAARVDGANNWQILRYITFPFLRPVILTILFIRIMDAFKIFDEVWILTGGGPAQATRFVSIHIVRNVLAQTEYGYGACMSVFVLYLTIVMCWLLLVIIKREALKS